VTGFGGARCTTVSATAKFEDVTEKAGVGGSGFMTGAAGAITTATALSIFTSPATPIWT